MEKRLSGRFVLRIEPELHALAKRRATQLDISLNELCVRSLNAYLTETPSTFEAVRYPEADLARRVIKYLGNSLVGLVFFGSMARGEGRESSDIDLLIVVSQNLSLKRQLYTQWDRTIVNDRLSPHFVHLPTGFDDAGSLWLESSVDGIVMFDRDGGVQRFLGSMRRAIASGILERRKAYGHTYWIKSTERQEHVQ